MTVRGRRATILGFDAASVKLLSGRLSGRAAEVPNAANKAMAPYKPMAIRQLNQIVRVGRVNPPMRMPS